MKIVISPSKTMKFSKTTYLEDKDLLYPKKHKKVLASLRKLSKSELSKALSIKGDILDNTFNASHPYFTADQRQDLLTYREMQFIIAETSSDDMEQHTAYINGIRASFAEFGLGDSEADTYIAQAMIDPGAGNLTMDHIMTQKYIAMFAEPEAHADWRRTGIPSLTPVAGSAIPRRWHYPENEYLFNSSTPARDADLMFKRVDWDN